MDATDSFYQWIYDKTMPGSRPSPRECYEAGYNNALAGIPNPEAVRELVEAARQWAADELSGVSVYPADLYLMRAIQALSAPSASPQQK